MKTFSAYIPMDRRQALANQVTLPDRANGAVLFADISGFTPLTTVLAQDLGPQRGAEELTPGFSLSVSHEPGYTRAGMILAIGQASQSL
jgi:hypothetical protein